MDILGTEASWGKYISISKNHRTLKEEGDKNCVFKDELVSDNERALQIESNKYTKQKAINTQSQFDVVESDERLQYAIGTAKSPM